MTQHSEQHGRPAVDARRRAAWQGLVACAIPGRWRGAAGLAALASVSGSIAPSSVRAAPVATRGAELVRAGGAPWRAEPGPGDLDAELRWQRARSWFTDTLLVDQDQRRHAFYSDLLAPRTVLIQSAFIGCHGACPPLTQQLVQLRHKLGDRFGREVWFLSITVDPQHDDPTAWKRFALRHGADHPGWRFLGGSPDDVRRVMTRLGLWPDSLLMHRPVLLAGRARTGRWGHVRQEGGASGLFAQLGRFLP